MRLGNSASGMILVAALACALNGATAAPPETVCLTGNAPGQGRHLLQTGRYRIVWSGTSQPITLGNPLYRDWVPFSLGITDPKCSPLPGDLSLVKDDYKKLRIKYAWPKNGYSIEVDLGQVCRISSFALAGDQSEFAFKVFYPETGRWLAAARHKTKVEFENLAARRFRVEADGFPRPAGATFSQMTIWGAALGDAPETLPSPLPAGDAVVPYRPLELKPGSVPAQAPDPFIFPQPHEMEFGDERLLLPRDFAIVAAPDAGVRQAADNFTLLLGRLADVEPKIREASAGPCVWLGLAGAGGPGREMALRYSIGPDRMPAEGYALEINRNGVFAAGRDIDGLNWAAKTLILLARPEAQGGISLPIGYVRDFPRAPHRPIHGYPGWRGEFKAGLLEALIAFKNNLVVLRTDEVCAEIVRRNRVRQTVTASLFPGSACGTGGDMLEISPGRKTETLNLMRLSACPSHTAFWPGMFKAFPQSPSDLPGQFVDVCYDEIMHNPFMVCARCRARGLSQREILLDAFMKAYNQIVPQGYGVSVYATGFQKVSKAFDMFLDIPTNNVLVYNYDRKEQNKILSDRGLEVISGSTSTIDLNEGDPESAAIVWNWCSGTRASMMGRIVPWMLAQSEENWTAYENQSPYGSPEHTARLNRAMAFARHVIDATPLEVPGVKRGYFTIDLSKSGNRNLRDEVYGDGKDWLDEGPTRDLRHLGAGRQVLRSIPYDIGAAAVIVAGPDSADDRNLPDQVLGIPVNHQASELVFLHACARPVWTGYGRCVVLLGYYRVRYEDGSFLTVPVNYGEHLLEWNRAFNYRAMEFEPAEEPASCAEAAWRGLTDGGHDATLYAMRWRNPYPEKKIACVDVLASAQNESNRNRLCLVALSGGEVLPADLAIAARDTRRPSLRTYRERPALPAGVEAIDLTRLSTPPLPLLPESSGQGAKWATADGWISASAASAPYEKGDYFLGVYSALHPDDNAWVGSGPFVIQLKRAAPLRGIGVKGRMQPIRVPEFYPVTLEIEAQKADGAWMKVGKAEQHVGQEGEERWIFPEEIEISQVRITLSEGSGLSAVFLYGKPLGDGRIEFERPPSSADALGEKKKPTDEEILDFLEGK